MRKKAYIRNQNDRLKMFILLRWNKNKKCDRQSRIKGQGGPGQFLLDGLYDVIHDVIVCKSCVSADSQGSRLFFPVIENRADVLEADATDAVALGPAPLGAPRRVFG